jgi:hypothetical protein
MQVVRASVDKRTKNMCEELDVRIHGTQIDVQAAKTPIEDTWCEFKTKPPEGFNGVVFYVWRELHFYHFQITSKSICNI